MENKNKNHCEKKSWFLYYRCCNLLAYEYSLNRIYPRNKNQGDGELKGIFQYTTEHESFYVNRDVVLSFTVIFFAID